MLSLIIGGLNNLRPPLLQFHKHHKSRNRGYFCDANAASYMGFQFQAGAMPKLQRLTLQFDPRPGVGKSHTSWNGTPVGPPAHPRGIPRPWEMLLSTISFLWGYRTSVKEHCRIAPKPPFLYLRVEFFSAGEKACLGRPASLILEKKKQNMHACNAS